MSNIFIIAEAGVNHNGNMNIAKKMIDCAKKAGVNAIKFQLFKTEEMATKYAEKTRYQLNATNKHGSQYQMLKALELNEAKYKILLDHAKKKKILLLSSPFDLGSIDLLRKFGMKIWKIPSGEINNVPYLEKIGKFNNKVILSTGMSYLNEIRTAVQILTNAGTNKKNITILHCNTEYPSPIKDVNLNAMLTIRDKLKVKVGYSDHTLGIEIPIAAAALGAMVIEKHFTLNKNFAGPDHKASLDPKELMMMVNSIRHIEVALGNGVKKPSSSEIKNIKNVRKSIVAKYNIKKGEIFSPYNITVKRPGTGISPISWYKIIGKFAKKQFKTDDPIKV